MDRIDILVVGAGVIGLACARALARAGREVIIVERAAQFGTGVSSRSSEVMHAGLYDAPGTLKATLCVRGNRLLSDYCRERGIPHRRCGKLVVATRPQDADRLEAIRARGGLNGVPGLEILTRAQALALEPELQCEAALWSPSSGIVDSHALMTALLGDAEQAGALLAVASRFQGASPAGTGWRVRVTDAFGAVTELQAACIVNAAGLDAQAVAAAVEGLADAAIPPRHLARGHYFGLAGRAPFGHLIYPLPVDGGLGVHLTLDLGGQARFGPDVEWLQSAEAGADLDYRVDPARAEAFHTAVRRYWPRLPAGALQPAYSGIRPKLSGPGQAPVDFRLDGPAEHGLPGLVNLFGIESPGLTAAMALAETVVAIVG